MCFYRVQGGQRSGYIGPCFFGTFFIVDVDFVDLVVLLRLLLFCCCSCCGGVGGSGGVVVVVVGGGGGGGGGACCYCFVLSDLL